MKQKVLEFLQSNPPVWKRRTPWNIAMNIGERENVNLVVEALRELVHEGSVKFHSAKGMSYRATKTKP